MPIRRSRLLICQHYSSWINDLALIEQPLANDDFVQHAWLQQQLHTAICLDENILTLADVQTAVALKSCRAINLKLPVSVD